MTKSENGELKSICVFCGSSAGERPLYRQAAEALGAAMARRRLTLVYGGGSIGLMGVLARSARAHGCEVVGVIPEPLQTQELAGAQIGELIVVKTMHERKAVMTERADAFIAMPGGFGTLDELFETLTWGQLGIHNKPIGLFNIDDFFQPLLRLIENAVAEGFVRPIDQGRLVVADEANAMLTAIAAHKPPPGLITWMDLDQA
ncbi:MAG: TIGR00730 family Rossman fold protein [Caldilineaceae bacterium]|nr:TIGR00730 family Rossman fold protein [Caldilineaceae bacterium]